MKTRFSLVILIIVFSFHLGFSQEGEDLELPNFVPPSPTAYELGKYGEFPIAMFTGAVQSSVPLMGFKTRDISIPISLSYHSNGIKVDQLETKVGLGWNLIAGGMISRTVNQHPDELRTTLPPQNETDYFTHAWIDYFQLIGYETESNAYSPYVDGEPDIFSFNFLGYSGRFTFNNKLPLEIVMLDYVPLQIEFDSQGYGSFTITDEKGIIYTFADVERTKLNIVGGQPQYNFTGQFVTSAWYLTDITTPNSDVITFEYANEVYDYITTQTQQVTIPANPLQQFSNDMCQIPYAPPIESPIIDNDLYVEGKRLTKISSNNSTHGEVTFQYNTNHATVSNYKLLSSVSLKDENTSVIENVNLSYNAVSQRLFLDEVQFLDPGKKYEFEYTDLYQFPQRLSFSKDHWGYYNGKSNSTLYPDLSGLNNIQGNMFANAFPNGGADKEIDENKAKKGLLKKVIYPTKGYTEIEYESNDFNTITETSSIAYASMDIMSQASSTATEVLDITDVEDDILAELTINFSLNYQSSCATQGPVPDEADRKLFITIENLTNTGQTNIIKKLIPILGTTQGAGNHITLTEDMAYNDQYYFDLDANNDYRITLNLYHGCLMGQLLFSYPDSASQLIYINKKTGGLRVAKTTNYNYDDTIISEKKYHYASKDDLTKSSGVNGYDPYYITAFKARGSCTRIAAGGITLCYPWSLDYLRLNSGALNAMYRTSVQTTRYKHVTVSEEDGGFSNGGTEYRYRTSIEGQPHLIFGTFSNILSENYRTWGDGLLLEKTVFKVDGSTHKNILKEVNTYVNDSRIDNVVNGYKASRNADLACWTYVATDPTSVEWAIEEALLELNVTQYYLTSNWTYLASKARFTYDTNGQNPVEEIINYQYDNPDHLQLTQTQAINSDGESIITTMMYPDDVSSISSLGNDVLLTPEFNAIKKLKHPDNDPNGLHHIGQVIQTSTYQDLDDDGLPDNNELLSVQRTNFEDLGNDIILPKDMQTLKGMYNSTNNKLQNRIIFEDYYANGNVKEVSKADGVPIVYIWGYNEVYPIAKIENATFSTVEAAIATLNSSYNTLVEIQSLSDSDDDNCLDSGTCDEKSLREALNALRNALPDAMVTTYTYDPLIGVTSITDPKGYITYYEYDDFNRLKWVKDDVGNILSQNHYHYKEQP